MASIQYYDVIIRPVITEKSMNAMGEKKYTFLVFGSSSSGMIWSMNLPIMECSLVPIR